MSTSSRAQRVEALTRAFESQVVAHFSRAERDFKLREEEGTMRYMELTPLEQLDLLRGIQDKYSCKDWIVDIRVYLVDGETRVKLRFIVGWCARLFYVCCPC